MALRNRTVVMIHGAFCAGWAFDKFRQPFEAEGMRVIAPDLRHHDVPPRGEPPRALGLTRLKDFADDIVRLIEDEPEPPVLIGHSMGGLVAQIAATRTPVAALVLLAPSAPWGVMPSSPHEIATATGLLFSGESWDRPVRPRYRLAAAHALDRLPPGERSDTFSRFVHESGRATFEIWHWPWDLARGSDVRPARVNAPVLCLAGTHDQINPLGTVRRVARRYRGETQEFFRMSHWLLGEPGWENVADAALHFIAQT